MSPKPKRKRTRYCNHYHNCDLDRECFNVLTGDDCPFFGHTTLFSSLPKEPPTEAQEGGE